MNLDFLTDDDLTKKIFLKNSTQNSKTSKGNIGNNNIFLLYQNYYLVNDEFKPYSFYYHISK